MSDINDVLLKEFVSAHLVKWDKELVYNGELEKISSTVDNTLAAKWYDKIEKNIQFTEFKLDLYGDSYAITIPVFSDFVKKSETTDITKSYRLLVSDYLKDWLFSDRRWMMLFKLLDTFDVVTFDWTTSFFPKTDMSDNIIKNQTSSIFTIGDLKAELDINNLNDINRYENIILLFKEVSEWYYDTRVHSMVDKQWPQYVQQEYVLGRDIYAKVNTQTKEVLEVTQEETKYKSRKDKDAWYIIQPDGSEINSRDFVPYMSTSDGDITEIRLYWAYTHVLRDLLDFKPLTRQYKFLLNQKRISFIAWCRRSGKTRFLAYAICRSLWKQPNSNKHVQRHVKSLYVAPSEDKQKEVIDYIKTSAERFRVLRVLDFNKKENRLYLFDEVIGRQQKVQNIVSSCDLVSGKWFEPGRGKASDEIFIDEGSIINEDVRLNLLPIIENEKAKVTAMGTIDWTSRRQRFYQRLIESEKWIDDEQYWLRVTIDDIDDELIDQWAKDRMKRALKDNKERYYAELYATFPENNSVFNGEWFFQITKDRQPFEKVGWYIIWYDPAKRTDIWAIEVGEYRMWNSWAYIQIIEEYSLQGEYSQQKQVVKQIKERYQMNWLSAPVYLVIDATQVWDVVAEMFWDIVDYKVWYTSKGKRPIIDNYWAWKVPKNHLVHLSQILIEKWLIKWRVWLKELIDEMRNFKAIDTAAGNVKYEAEVGHDDHVNAMMLIWFYMWYIEWRVYEFSVDWFTARPEWITEDGLYEEQTKRMTVFEEVIGKSYSFWV